jgi:hypothetical protein
MSDPDIDSMSEFEPEDPAVAARRVVQQDPRQAYQANAPRIRPQSSIACSCPGKIENTI